MGNTARIAIASLILPMVSLFIIMILIVIPSSAGQEEMIAQAIKTIGDIAVGATIGGSIGAGAHGLRHFGSRAPTSSMMEDNNE